MSGHRHLVRVACAIALLGAALGSNPVIGAADKEKPKTAYGILMEKRDKWIELKADGEDAAVKYSFDAADKKLAAALKPIFNVSRVGLAYRLGSDGESRQLVGIRKLRTAAVGTVTGEVLAVHNNFWIELKPKGQPPDGYALNGPAEKFKGFVEIMKGLKKGDIVTIRFSTDFERHRIQGLKKIKGS